jgi:hypothetical protein
VSIAALLESWSWFTAPIVRATQQVDAAACVAYEPSRRARDFIYGIVYQTGPVVLELKVHGGEFVSSRARILDATSDG